MGPKTILPQFGREGKPPTESPLGAALAYARRGWRVVPCHGVVKGRCTCGRDNCSSPGKHPLTSNGVKDATTDEATIRDWWRKWPNANVAIATGRVSSIFVLDVDPDKGGEDSLRELERKHGPLPETPECLTGGGGRHLYFAYPDVERVPNKVGLAPGLDIRGDGGYVVAPPSLHVRGAYFWEVAHHPDDVLLASAPDWLINLFKTLARAQTAEALPEKITKGERNTRLASLAGSLRRRGGTFEEILISLRVINRSRCEPPLEEAEVEGIARSISRYSPGPKAEVEAQKERGKWGGGGKKVRIIDLVQQALKALFMQDGKLLLHYWRGAFYEWTGTHYREVPKADLKARLSRFAIQSEHVRDINTQLISNLIAALEGHCLIPHYFEPPFAIRQKGGDLEDLVITPLPGVVAFHNGVLDFDKWLKTSEPELRPHTPDLFTLVALPYDFNLHASCPRWLAFLEENLEGKKDRIALLQDFAGYCLTYDTRLHKFLMLYGDAATGKSTFTTVLIEMLGRENVSHVPLEGFSERFGLARTVGKLANIVSEVGELDRIAEGHLKEFVAGDRMQVERKHLDPFEVKPTAKLILATNNLPRFSDRSRGLWRRLIIVPFTHPIPEEKRDPFLAERIIESELPGVFLWAAMGLARLRSRGRFSPCQEAEELAKEYERTSNPARLFLEEHYEVDPQSQVPCAQVYRAYVKWARENGYQALHERNFGKEVKRVFPQSERRYRGGRGNRVWVYVGIREQP